MNKFDLVWGLNLGRYKHTKSDSVVELIGVSRGMDQKCEEEYRAILRDRFGNLHHMHVEEFKNWFDWWAG